MGPVEHPDAQALASFPDESPTDAVRRRSRYPKFASRPDAPSQVADALRRPIADEQRELGDGLLPTPVDAAVECAPAGVRESVIADDAVVDAMDVPVAPPRAGASLDGAAPHAPDETRAAIDVAAELMLAAEAPAPVVLDERAPDLGEPAADVPAPSVAPPAAEPSRGDVLYTRARALAGEGDVKGARTAYKELLALDGAHVKGRNNLALLLAEMGDLDGALVQFAAAIEREPENATLLANRAAVLASANRYDPAEADMRRAMKIAPDDADLLLQFAVLRSRRGRWSDAVEPLERAVALRPEHAVTLFHYGEALNQTGRLADAVAAFREAVRLSPLYWRAHKGLGNVLDRLGRPDEAALSHRAARAAQQR